MYYLLFGVFIGLMIVPALIVLIIYYLFLLLCLVWKFDLQTTINLHRRIVEIADKILKAEERELEYTEKVNQATKAFHKSCKEKTINLTSLKD